MTIEQMMSTRAFARYQRNTDRLVYAIILAAGFFFACAGIAVTFFACSA